MSRIRSKDYYDFIKQVGTNLEDIMKLQGLNQSKLARISGVSQGMLSRTTRGYLGLNLYDAYAISKALNITMEELITGELEEEVEEELLG